MNMESARDDGEFPPPWFSNEEPEPEEEQSDLWRWLLGIGILTVTLVMLLIPVLQAEILQRHRESLPDEEFERTALLFASAMLFGRSEGQAMIFAVDAAHEDVRSTLRVLLDRPQPSRQARLQVFSMQCDQRHADACFRGRLLDTAVVTSAAIRYGIDDTDEGPKIVWVELDELSAGRRLDLHRRYRTFVGSPFEVRVVPFNSDKAVDFGHLQTQSEMAL